MSPGNDGGLGNKPIIVLIGLVGSLIAIFTFITGKQDVGEVFDAPAAIEYSASGEIMVEEPGEVTIHGWVEPPASPTPEPTPRPTIIPVETVGHHPGVSIVVKDFGEATDTGHVRFQVLADDTPVIDAGFIVSSAVVDITGTWTADKTVYGIDGEGPIHWTNSAGVFDLSLEPGNYAALLQQSYSGRPGHPQMAGGWGVLGTNDDGIPRDMIVFPVVAGKSTEIIVSLAHLEVGVIAASGDAAKGRAVYINCQGTDIAGGKIASDRCREEGDGTDSTGIAEFAVGPGTYFITVDQPGSDDFDVYDITLKAGETRREIVRLPW